MSSHAAPFSNDHSGAGSGLAASGKQVRKAAVSLTTNLAPAISSGISEAPIVSDRETLLENFNGLHIIALNAKLLHAVYCPTYNRGAAMKITTKLYAALMVAILSSNANASDMYSIAYVSQIGSGSYSRSFATISTKDIVKPMFQVASAMSALKPSQGNLGLVWQDGDTNNASVMQDGVGNVGLIRQIGLENTASITQNGSGHQALVFQQGRGNVAIIHQR